MIKKLLPLSLLLGVAFASYGSNSDSKDSGKVENAKTNASQISSKNSCPTSQDIKTINMKDMTLSYFKYQDHICGTLKVDLSANETWSKEGSGWFAAGFGAPSMKGSNMFIFVPKNTDVKNTKYDIFANVGGGYGPTKPLNTKPKAGQIKILSSSLGKVSFVLYPNKVEGLSSDDKNIEMIFSHSKAGVTEFVPGHIAKYANQTLDLS